MIFTVWKLKLWILFMDKKLFIEVIHGYAKYHGHYSGSTMEVNHSMKLIMGPQKPSFWSNFGEISEKEGGSWKEKLSVESDFHLTSWCDNKKL